MVEMKIKQWDSFLCKNAFFSIVGRQGWSHHYPEPKIIE